MNRTEILKKANECVTGSRQQDYGEIEDNFGRIAKLWSAYTGHEYTAFEVAMMLGLVKVGRAASGRLHIDNFIDLAGYAACAGEIACRETKNPYPVKIEHDIPKEEGKKLKYRSCVLTDPLPKLHYDKKLIETAKKRLKKGEPLELSVEMFKAFCGKLYEEACNES